MTQTSNKFVQCFNVIARSKGSRRYAFLLRNIFLLGERNTDRAAWRDIFILLHVCYLLLDIFLCVCFSEAVQVVSQ